MCIRKVNVGITYPRKNHSEQNIVSVIIKFKLLFILHTSYNT